MIFAAASCQKDNLQHDPAVDGEQVNVTFTVELPADVQTKAISDGSMAEDLYYEIYRGANGAANDGTLVPSFAVDKNAPVTFVKEGEKYVARISLNLVKNYKYDIAFWAMDKDCNVYSFGTPQSLKTIKVDYKDMANSEDRDAFTAVVKDYVANVQPSKTVYLHRPFAQVNFLATDYHMLQELGVKDMKSKVHFKGLADSFNALDQKAEGSVETDLELEVVPVENGHMHPNYTGTSPYLTHGWVAMNYVLPVHELSDVEDHTTSEKVMSQEPITATFQYNGGQTVSLEVPNVPYQRNFRTNIIGDLFSGQADFTIEIVPIYEDYDHIKKITPAQPVEGGYVVNGLSELLWVADQASLGETFAGKTITLAADIDLTGQDWTPIPNFKGTLVGAATGAVTYTKADQVRNAYIKGLEVNYTEGPAGLIGTLNGTVKNITLVAPKVTGAKAVGTVAGQIFNTGLIEGCEVVDAVVAGQNYVGGVVGSIYGSVKNNVVTNLQATATPALKKDVYDYGDKVGGVVGFSAGDNKGTIEGNKVDGAVIRGYRDLGSVVGAAIAANVMNNEAANADVAGIDGTAYQPYDEGKTQENIGGLVGRDLK